MQRPELSARARAALDAWVRPGLTNTPLPPDPAGVWRVVQASDAEVRVASDDGGAATMRITFGTVSDVQVGTPAWAGGGSLTAGRGLASSMPAPSMPPPTPRPPAMPAPSMLRPPAPAPVSAPAPTPTTPRPPAPAPVRTAPVMPAPVAPPAPTRPAASPPPAGPVATWQSDQRMPLPGGGGVRVQEHVVQYRVGGADLAGQPPGDIPVPPPVRPALHQAPDLEAWVDQVANRSRLATSPASAVAPLAGETREEREERLALKAVLESQSNALGKTMLRGGGALLAGFITLPQPWSVLCFAGLMFLSFWGVKKSGRLSHDIRQLAHAPGPAGTMGTDAPSSQVRMGIDVASGDR